MIITVTPNPALDVGGLVPAWTFGEKNYVTHSHLYPAGNGINVSRMIKRLGGKSIAMGFLGGPFGKEIEKRLSEEAIQHQFIPIQSHSRMNISIQNDATKEQLRLNFPGPKVTKTEIASLQQCILQTVKPNDIVVLGGSLPDGMQVADLLTLIDLLEARKVYYIGDFPGDLLKEVIHKKWLMIKPNYTEFKQVIGKNNMAFDEIIKEAKTLSKHIDWVCVSSVEQGAVLAHQNQVCFGQIPPVDIHTSVGAGDSMVAAMTLEWHNCSRASQKAEIKEMLIAGLAAACATLCSQATELGTQQDYQALKDQIILKQIDTKRF